METSKDWPIRVCRECDAPFLAEKDNTICQDCEYDAIATSVGGLAGSSKVENLAADLARLREVNAKLLDACKAVIAAHAYQGDRWVGCLYEAKEQVIAAIAFAKEKPHAG